MRVAYVSEECGVAPVVRFYNREDLCYGRACTISRSVIIHAVFGFFLFFCFMFFKFWTLEGGFGLSFCGQVSAFYYFMVQSGRQNTWLTIEKITRHVFYPLKLSLI